MYKYLAVLCCATPAFMWAQEYVSQIILLNDEARYSGAPAQEDLEKTAAAIGISWTMPRAELMPKAPDSLFRPMAQPVQVREEQAQELDLGISEEARKMLGVTTAERKTPPAAPAEDVPSLIPGPVVQVQPPVVPQAPVLAPVSTTMNLQDTMALAEAKKEPMLIREEATAIAPTPQAPAVMRVSRTQPAPRPMPKRGVIRVLPDETFVVIPFELPIEQGTVRPSDILAEPETIEGRQSIPNMAMTPTPPSEPIAPPAAGDVLSIALEARRAERVVEDKPVEPKRPEPKAIENFLTIAGLPRTLGAVALPVSTPFLEGVEGTARASVSLKFLADLENPTLSSLQDFTTFISYLVGHKIYHARVVIYTHPEPQLNSGGGDLELAQRRLQRLLKTLEVNQVELPEENTSVFRMLTDRNQRIELMVGVRD